MQKMLRFLLAALCIVSLGASAQQATRPPRVSIIQLIATPEQFDGKEVWVSGYLQLEPEDTWLFLHRDDAVNGLTQNALWINQDSKYVAEHTDEINCHYVDVAATFKANDKARPHPQRGTLHTIKGIMRVPGGT